MMDFQFLIRILGFALPLFLPLVAQAAPPPLLAFQGQVKVGTEPFDGTGSFKFALVNGDGSTTYWSHNGTSSGGSEPTASLTINVTNGNYAVFLGDTSVTGMDALPVTVFDNDDVHLRVWFDDGVNGFEQLSPDHRIVASGYAMMALSVPADSIGSAELQDAAVTPDKIASGAVSSDKIAAGAVGPDKLASAAVESRHLSAGAVGAAQIAPGAARDNLLSGGDAPVARGGIVLSDDALVPELQDNGFTETGTIEFSKDQWFPGPPPFQVKGSMQHTSVWTGTEMLIWDGVVAARMNPASGAWTMMSTENMPSPRWGHTAVWTGTEMIIFGGVTGSEEIVQMTVNGERTVTFRAMTREGAAYNPTTDSWRPIRDLPEAIGEARARHVAVWTGSEMFVWGGVLERLESNPLGPLVAPSSETVNLGEGAFYNPATNQWRSAGSSGSPPTPRADATAVWDAARNQVVVWGGAELTSADDPFGVPSSPFSSGEGTGSKLDVDTGVWTAMSTTDAPSRRSKHTMTIDPGLNLLFVLGGETQAFEPLESGGIYFLDSDTWVPTTDAPAPFSHHTTTKTSQGFFIFGGRDGTTYTDFGVPDGTTYNDKAYLFNQLTNQWTTLPVPNPDVRPAPRAFHTAVWNGSEVMIWGGAAASDIFSDGALYDPANDEWDKLNAPQNRYNAESVWTGEELIVWGGIGSDGETLNSGYRYNPVQGSWTVMAPSGAPAARVGHSMTWAPEVDRILVWGGFDGNTHLSDGAFYEVGQNTWSPAGNFSPPDARRDHTCVWTGTSFLVWGGTNGTAMGDGKALIESFNLWSPIGTSGEPVNRTNHSAIWTGSEMIVFGGINGTSYRSTGGRYDPSTSSWQSLPFTSNRPSPRLDHTAVWTGDKMIVWGGLGPSGTVGTGSIYDPDTHTWTPMATLGAPGPRTYHTTVWTGSRMIVWGGLENIFLGPPLASGGIYNPDGDTWRSTLEQGFEPQARGRHNAVWGDGEMIIFGGLGSQVQGDVHHFRLGQTFRTHEAGGGN